MNIFDNVSMKASAKKADGKTSWVVSVTGMDGKVDLTREFSDPMKMVLFLCRAAKSLDMELSTLEVSGANRAFSEAQRLLTEAQARLQQTVDNALASIDSMQNSSQPQTKVVEMQKPAVPMLNFPDDSTSEGAAEDKSLTPMMKQYNEMKKKHPEAILLFRCGDFYETYKEDAKVCSQILGITLTRRNTGSDRTEMAGFPHHALDTYLPKLIRAGKRVAICDEIEQSKPAVKRGRPRKVENEKEIAV